MRQVVIGSAVALSLAAGVAGQTHTLGATMAVDAPITWLVLVDDLHLDFRRTGDIRNVLKMALDTLVRNGDRLVVRSSGPSTLAFQALLADPPFDRDSVSGVVKRITGNALKPEDVTTPPARCEVRYRARVTVDTLQRLVDAALPIEGATVLLHFSNGYTTGAMDLSALVEQAERVRAVLYPIDPRPHPRALKDPFVLATRGSLRELANATGGTWQDDGETVEAYLARIAVAVGR